MSWIRFIVLYLPLSMAVIGIGAEIIGKILEPVPLRRQDVDKLVVAIERLTSDANIVLAGDSITQDVAKTYLIGGTGNVANMTTNQASGVIGLRMLLDRYLAKQVAPDHLVIAATPEFLGYEPSGQAAKVYVSSVFRRPEERKLIASFITTEKWRPAALSIQERLWDPLLSLAIVDPDSWPGGVQKPKRLPLEPPPTPVGVAVQINSRAAKPLRLAPSAEHSLRAICAQASKHNFTVHLIWAPMPHSVALMRNSNEGFAELNASLKQSLADCPRVQRHDFNNVISFPDHAFRDSDHLRRPGWTAHYALLLDEYLLRLRPSK